MQEESKNDEAIRIEIQQREFRLQQVEAYLSLTFCTFRSLVIERTDLDNFSMNQQYSFHAIRFTNFAHLSPIRNVRREAQVHYNGLQILLMQRCTTVADETRFPATVKLQKPSSRQR